MYRLCMHTRSLPVRAASGQSLFRKSRDWRHFRWKGPHYFWLHMCRTYFRDFRSGQLPVTWLTSLPVMHNGPIPIDPPQIRLELFPYTTHVYVVIHFCDHMWSFKCAVLFFCSCMWRTWISNIIFLWSMNWGECWLFVDHHCLSFFS
jgi:hypothetical protein